MHAGLPSLPPLPDRPAWCPARTFVRFWAKVDRSAGPTGCWPWMGAYNTPMKRPWKGTRRPIFRATSGQGKDSPVYAHRYALALTDGVDLKARVGLHACHVRECSNPKCVNGAHLYWGTDAENREDRRSNGTSPR